MGKDQTVWPWSLGKPAEAQCGNATSEHHCPSGPSREIPGPWAEQSRVPRKSKVVLKEFSKHVNNVQMKCEKVVMTFIYLSDLTFYRPARTPTDRQASGICLLCPLPLKGPVALAYLPITLFAVWATAETVKKPSKYLSLSTHVFLLLLLLAFETLGSYGCPLFHQWSESSYHPSIQR